MDAVSSLWVLGLLISFVVGLAAAGYHYTRENSRVHVELTATLAVLNERSAHVQDELDRLARNVHDIRKELLHAAAKRSILKGGD